MERQRQFVLKTMLARLPRIQDRRNYPVLVVAQRQIASGGVVIQLGAHGRKGTATRKTGLVEILGKPFLNLHPAESDAVERIDDVVALQLRRIHKSALRRTSRREFCRPSRRQASHPLLRLRFGRSVERIVSVT
jgi:hypothetical protein